ncbi:MAG: winged helix-turn-helix domain-containing protein [Euryarchaeota archaeon]|nr:winged helix-turn-helix domain-containing protein [Euryarchaeota archaeon]
MTNIAEEFGKNAGEIWKTLNTTGPLPESKLMQLTNLHEDEFYVAVGWLARENKICKNGPMYKLGDTNLAPKIGYDAGKIWKILETKGSVDIYDMATLAQIEERETYSALGWLARENKIEPKTTRIPKEYTIRRY